MKTKIKLGKSVKGKVYSLVSRSVYRSVDSSVSSSVRSSVQNSVWSSVWLSVDDLVRSSVNNLINILGGSKPRRERDYTEAEINDRETEPDTADISYAGDEVSGQDLD